ncbi:MAG: glycosyltransferase family 2 protein [Pseudomonadota bacterium]
MDATTDESIRYLSGRAAFGSEDLVARTDDKRSPRVSVVTTVLNRVRTIERAVVSVLEQSYPSIEYVVMDGGSEDGTCEVLAKYSDVIDHIESGVDSGIYDGMNRGIRRATGEYIILLNSDDWYVPTCIETLMSAVLDRRLDAVSALAYEVDECGKNQRQLPRTELGYNVFLRMPLRHETMLVSRKVYDDIGLFDESYQIIGDLKHTQRLFRRIEKQAYRFEQLNEPVMYFRKDGAASILTEKFIRERERLLKENFPDLRKGDLELLANEYQGDPEPYSALASSNESPPHLKKAIRAFLAMHGVN